MITGDNNLKKLAKDVLDGSFSLPLIEVVLKSCGREKRGKGVLFQNKGGKLRLHFFSDVEATQNERLQMICDSSNGNPEGTILGDKDYWELWGRDENNFEVSCKKVHSHWPYDTSAEFVIDTPLKYEAFCHTSCIICTGDYEIPVSGTIHSRTEGDGFFYTDLHDCFEVKLNENLKVRAHSGKGCMDIVISHSGELKEETVRNIIRTLNFIFGVPLQNVMYSIKNQGYWIMTDTTDEGYHTAYCPPISNRISHGREYCANHKELAVKYFAFIEKDDKGLLPILVERVHTARRTYIYIFAVTLATQIESLIKVYFTNYYRPDTSWNPTLDKCIKIVEAASADVLSKDEKNHLKDILSRNKIKEEMSPQEIVVRKVLDAMCNDGVIRDNKLCAVWSRLRNKTAHGEIVTDKGFIEESLTLLKDYYLCLNLYHQLIFTLVGYNGKYTYREFDNDREAEY